MELHLGIWKIYIYVGIGNESHDGMSGSGNGHKEGRTKHKEVTVLMKGDRNTENQG